MQEAESYIDDLCAAVYADTSVLYDQQAPGMGELALGYKILYGPPRTGAPYLFIGFQPGGGAEDAKVGKTVGERDRWPDHFEYAVANWRLARQARKVWNARTLEQCVGLNAIFFRCPDLDTWKRLPAAKAVEEFCVPKAMGLVSALTPQNIVVIGVSTFEKLSNGAGITPVLVSAKGRTLVRRGELWGRQVYVTEHLSAQISNMDLEAMEAFFASLI